MSENDKISEVGRGICTNLTWMVQTDVGLSVKFQFGAGLWLLLFKETFSGHRLAPLQQC